MITLKASKWEIGLMYISDQNISRVQVVSLGDPHNWGSFGLWTCRRRGKRQKGNILENNEYRRINWITSQSSLCCVALIWHKPFSLGYLWSVWSFSRGHTPYCGWIEFSRTIQYTWNPLFNTNFHGKSRGTASGHSFALHSFSAKMS